MTNISKVAVDCAIVILAMVDWQSIEYCVMQDVHTNNYRTLKEYAHGSRLLFVLVPTPCAKVSDRYLINVDMRVFAILVKVSLHSMGN